MNLPAFKRSLSLQEPPEALTPAVRALWWDANGDWDKAHDCAQAGKDKAAAWVHAYLHRKEGDLSNAGYWYRRAGKPVASGPLRTEWKAIVDALVTHS